MGKSTATKKYRLGMSELNHRVDTERLKFKTTAELNPLEGVIEQERALEALETGLSIKNRNYNIYIAGASGTGKSSILRRLLNRVAQTGEVPPDFCMVHSFRKPQSPLVLQFPPGLGIQFKAAMEHFIEQLRTEIPKTFHSPNHQERMQRILNEGLERESKAFTELNTKAQKFNFTVKRTKEGLATIPIVDGKSIGSKEYAELSDEQRAEIDSNRKKLDPLVLKFMDTTRKIELSIHAKVQKLIRSMGKTTIDHFIKPVRAVYKSVKDDPGYLKALTEHILENIPNFIPDETERRRSEREKRDPMIEYQVNLLVDNSETQGAPIVIESVPAYHNLVGKIEKRVENGIYSTDHMMVKAGALLQANGGYLVLQAKEVLTYPFAWEALNSVLRYQKLIIEEMGEAYQFLPTTGIRPDPIPVQVKVIMIGSNWIYHSLVEQDDEFNKVFQVKAEFDSEVRTSPDSLMEYARFVATTCKRDNLLPVKRDGVAAIIEYGMRLTGSTDQITLRFNEINNLLIEADNLARSAGKKLIDREHISLAREQRNRRISLLADKSLEEILDGTLQIHTEGAKIGTINGLALYSYGDVVFGRPLRITVKTFHGAPGVLNIEREASMAGSTYNKGVLILSGFLGDRFAQKRALGVTVSLTVEQSYGSIDGDSASCAELCGILSTLAQVPIRQDLAITGSVSQDGEVLAIGGVNEKVEGFYRICKARGFTGTQGVILPKSNIRHLMLEPEVLESIKKGEFSVYAVDRVEQALELLTGMQAGDLRADGTWTLGSIFDKVAKRLSEYADESPKQNKGARKPASKRGKA